MKRLAAAVLVAALAAGCAGKPVSLGTRPWKPAPPGQPRMVEGEACGFQLLLLIPLGVNSRQLRAYEQLLGQAGGDPVTDIEWKDSWIYALVGTVYCTSVRAKAIKRAAAREESPPTPEKPQQLTPSPVITTPLPDASKPPPPPAPAPEDDTPKRATPKSGVPSP